MASEGSLQLSLQVYKGGAGITQNTSFNFDVTGNQLVQNTQVIGLTSELVKFGDIPGVPQGVMIRNLDDTNSVEIGGDSGLTVFKIIIPRGQCAFFNPSSGTLYARANVAPVNILILAADQ